MKKINKRKIVMLIILIVLIIVELKAFTGSRANKLIEITANIVDNSGLLSDEVYTMQAINEGEAGYCITLPDIINDKKILEYIVEEKEMNQETSKEEQGEQITVENQIEGNIINETEVKDENDDKNLDEMVKKNPGEKLYITLEEVENKSIALKAEYDTKEKDEKILYSKIIR